MPKERSEVKDNLKWDLSDIFENRDEFHKLLEKTEKNIDFSSFEGRLGKREELLACFKKMDEVETSLEVLEVYAYMRKDLDTRDSSANADLSLAEDLAVKYSSSVSFVMPELTSLSEEYLNGVIADESFKDYDYALKRVLAEKPHVLSKECENLLASGGKVFGGYHDVFTMINNADLPFPKIEIDGKSVEVTHGTYGVLMQSENRETREKAFKAYYNAFISLINTISATYIGSVNTDVYFSKVRKYASCLESALEREDVSKKVYDNLLESVDEALPLLHRYISLRKKLLNFDEMHMWDVYVPLVENADIKLDYEDAFKLVKEGLKPLGEKYGELLQTAHDDGWIDVEETVGKRSGAYSICVYGLKHPFVLLNYQKTTNEVFTIAHELGHSIHSYKSDEAQPKAKADYKIFVAEVASTVNEVLLLKYLLKTTEDKNLKKYLLSYYLDMIRTTLFRQTMFAEFEYITHTAVENGEPLTKDFLCKKYLALNEKYYGKDIVSDEEISYEWARIPHFYTSFYVYKYATGIISAISIAERIYEKGEEAVNDYFKFLSSGGSSSPTELLKLAGVDLTEKEVYRSAMKSFENTLNEFEKI